MADRGSAPVNWQVIVGNVGTVYDGPSRRDAYATFNSYRADSKSGRGRAAGEPVTLMRGGDVFREHSVEQCRTEGEHLMAYKLKPEFKQKWLEALESGQYKQGRRNLNSNGEFCCLGVGCDVLIKEGMMPDAKWEPSDPTAVEDTRMGFVSGRERNYALPPMAALNEMFVLGDHGADVMINTPILMVRYNGLKRTLYELNDECKLSFQQIAAIIREQM